MEQQSPEPARQNRFFSFLHRPAKRLNEFVKFVRSCGWYPAAFGLLATLIVVGATVVVRLRWATLPEVITWMVPVGLGAFGLWAGVCRGSWGQSLLGLNLGVLLGVGTMELALRGFGLYSLLNPPVGQSSPAAIKPLLWNLSLWLFLAFAALGLVMGAFGRGRRPRLKRGALGGLIAGLALFFAVTNFFREFNPSYVLLPEEGLPKRALGLALGVIGLFVCLYFLSCIPFHLLGLGKREDAPPPDPAPPET